MTAFDNIKTNNWPATSNEFEDFLVLKMPLNNQASLAESVPVVAGSQGAVPQADVDEYWRQCQKSVGDKLGRWNYYRQSLGR